MIVAAWNTQRATNLKSKNPKTVERAGVALYQVRTWMSFHKDWRPELAFLTEVTQKGDVLAKVLNQQLDDNYTATFHANADTNGKASPCSFILIRRNSLKIEDRDITAHGASTQRPYLKVVVRSHDWTFAGVHIKANRKESFDEILTMLTDLSPDETACIIGDMNFNFTDIALLDQQQSKALAQLKFTAHDPGMTCTFVSSGTDATKSTDKIDFAFVSTGQRRVFAQPRPYKEWKTIDHAPIFYSVPAFMVLPDVEMKINS